MRRSKSYEVRDPMNIWNKYDFAMSGLGKKSKILAKIKHFFKCVKWSKQRITRGYCDCDVWEMFSFLQTLIPDMLQTLKDTRTGSPGYLGENYTNENGILVNDTCHEEWNCILDKMIFLWREAEKDTCSQKNPFDEAHSKAMDEFTERFRFLYKGIIINHNKKPSQPTLKRRFFKKKAAFFHGPVWERSGADFILKRKGEFF